MSVYTCLCGTDGYASLMADHPGSTAILHYVIEVQDHEFPLVIMSDQMSYWDDHTTRRRLRASIDQNLELRAFGGDLEAFDRLENECCEFTISVPLPDKIVTKAREMALAETKGETATQLVTSCTVEMDNLLTSFFWKEVNPLLSCPLQLDRD